MDKELLDRMKQEVVTSRLLQTVLQRLVAEDEATPTQQQQLTPAVNGLRSA